MKNFWIILVSIATLTACNSSIDAKKEISEIDDLLSQVRDAKAIYEKDIPHEELSWRLDSLKTCLAYLKANYESSMSEEDATKFDRYYNTKKIIHKYKSRAPQILKEFERTESQLSNFKGALLEGATQDKNGSIIDETYINYQMNREREAAEYLIKSVTELKERSSRFIKENEEKLQDILPYMNK